MPVALSWVNLNTHKCDAMLKSVKESVKIAPYARCNDMLIVPFPDNISRSGFYGSGAYVSWHSKLGIVSVNQSTLFDRPFQIILAHLWTVHTYGILANVNERAYFIRYKQS